jgi:hypothetical protein
MSVVIGGGHVFGLRFHRISEIAGGLVAIHGNLGQTEPPQRIIMQVATRDDVRRWVTLQKLKLRPVADDKPFRLTIELQAAVHRDLVAYFEALARETGQPVDAPLRLIVPIIEKFMGTDRGLTKTWRGSSSQGLYSRLSLC